MPNLRGLYIKWSNVTSIDPMSGLEDLRYLHLGSSTKVRSIEVLAKLSRLKWLGLENLKLIRDVEPIGDLAGLEGLVLGGSIWTTWRLRSLEPLSRLRSLQYLSLLNLRSDDKTLAPLFSMSRLETFETARWWDRGEIETIRRLNPKLAVAQPAASVEKRRD